MGVQGGGMTARGGSGEALHGAVVLSLGTQRPVVTQRLAIGTARLVRPVGATIRAANGEEQGQCRDRGGPFRHVRFLVWRAGGGRSAARLSWRGLAARASFPDG
jgi:hypothetical protein